jgi:hypothetical protein
MRDVLCGFKGGKGQVGMQMDGKWGDCWKGLRTCVEYVVRRTLAGNGSVEM